MGETKLGNCPNCKKTTLFQVEGNVAVCFKCNGIFAIEGDIK